MPTKVRKHTVATYGRAIYDVEEHTRRLPSEVPPEEHFDRYIADDEMSLRRISGAIEAKRTGQPLPKISQRYRGSTYTIEDLERRRGYIEKSLERFQAEKAAYLAKKEAELRKES